MGHHRYKIGFEVIVEEPTKNKQIPGDQTVGGKVDKQLKNLDVGDGYKVQDATVKITSKTPLP